MTFSLSRLELSCFRQLCGRAATNGELARGLNVTAGLVSRVAKALANKGFVSVEKNEAGRIVRVSAAPHAQSLRLLIASRPRVDLSWLAGKTIAALIVMASEGGVSSKLLAKECSCSKPTLLKLIRSAKGAGAIADDDGVYRVSDALVRKFVNDFADCETTSALRFKEQVMFARLRKHVVVRTDADAIPDFYIPTSITALEKFGLEYIHAGFEYYYFNLDFKKRGKLSAEEALVHGLFAAKHFRGGSERKLLGIFLKKHASRLDPRKETLLAEAFGVNAELRELRMAIEYSGDLGG